MRVSLKKSKIQPGVTPIENLFLDIYLPIVDEVSLKLYLFLNKRIFGSYSTELTFDSISSELGFSEIQIKNSFKFWKNEGLLDYELSVDGKIESVEFYNFYALYSGTLSVDEDVIKEKTVEKPLIETGEYVDKIESLIGLKLQPHEITKIIDCIEETGHNWNMVYRAYLYADTNGKSKSASYITGILRGWKRDNGILTEQDLENFLSKKGSRRKLGSINTSKKYIEDKDILTEEEKKEKLNEDNKNVMDLLKGY